jgi:hypothetical protein
MTELFERAAAYQGVLYSVFQMPLHRSEANSLIVALTAAHPGAGTTHLTEVLAEALKQDHSARTLTLDGRQLFEMSGTPLPLMEELIRPREGGAELLSCPPEFNVSWRGSREYRAAYLARLRQQFSYILIDCPSLKESQDILGLAPLVDGTMIVVEANRTTKSQVSYLERTLEGAGGKILGQILNKRTYPIPEWVHTRMESLGI